MENQNSVTKQQWNYKGVETLYAYGKKQSQTKTSHYKPDHKIYIHAYTSTIINHITLKFIMIVAW
jgi:hypothetical protein